MWSDELIARLKGYAQHPDFVVLFRGDPVHEVEERNPDEGIYGWPAYFMEGAEDTPHELEERKPEDFTVFKLQPIAWASASPVASLPLECENES